MGFEVEQTLKNQQMLAKEVNLAGREQQCSFRWAKLSTMLRKFEAEEEQKRQQREAGTKRLAKMKETLTKTQEWLTPKSFWTKSLISMLLLKVALLLKLNATRKRTVRSSGVTVYASSSKVLKREQITVWFAQ